MTESKGAVDPKLNRANSETWVEHRRVPATRRMPSALEPDGDDSASRRRSMFATFNSDEYDSSSISEHSRKPSLTMDMGGSASNDEMDLSSALSEVTALLLHENLTGTAVRFPPEVVKDRLQKISRSLTASGIEPSLASHLSDQSEPLIIRFVNRNAVQSPTRDRPVSASGSRPRTRSSQDSRSSSPRLSVDVRSRLSNDGAGAHAEDLTVPRGSHEASSFEEKIVAVDETSTPSEILPLVMDKYSIEGVVSEYCLVVCDPDGSERLIADDELPLSLQSQADVYFRVRRRRSIELQNERLFKQIMEEEGQLSSLEYFTRSDSQHSLPRASSDDLTLPQLSFHKENAQAASPNTTRLLELPPPTPEVSFTRSAQWELIGAPLDALLSNTLGQLEQQLSYWKERVNETPAQNPNEFKGMLNNILRELEALHTNSSGAYHELLDAVEKEIPLILPVKGYRIEACLFSSSSPFAMALLVSPKEDGTVEGDGLDELDPDLKPIFIDETEPVLHHANNHPVFKDYFHDRRHTFRYAQLNFLGNDPKFGPMCVSLVREVDEESRPRFRALIWTRDGCHVRFLPCTNSMNLRGEVLAELLSAKLSSQINVKEQFLTCVYDEDVSSALLKMESDQLETAYKIGVLYVKEGQVREDEMFGNVESSAAFEEFLTILGDRIVLKGWNQFKAGLDSSADSTGTHSVYTQWRNLEIMYHVSTLLPFDPADVQQLARKRHIGNDICVILFVDGTTPYLPDTVASRFNHVFAVVRANPDNTYSLAVATKDSIPLFGPEITRKRYPRDPSFRDLLLSKLINGQNAAYRAPVFKEKLRRTREFLLNDIVDRFLKSTSQSGSSSNRPATLSHFSSKSAKNLLTGTDKEKIKLSKMMKSLTVKKLSSTFSGSTASINVPSSVSSETERSDSPSGFRSRFSASFGSRRSTLDTTNLKNFKKKDKDSASSTESSPVFQSDEEIVATIAVAAPVVQKKLSARDDFV